MIRYLLLFLCGTAPLAAQDLSNAWFVTAGGGVVAFDNSAFSHRLQQYVPVGSNGESITYSTPDFPTNGYTIDASFGLLFNSRIVVGLSGQALSFNTIRAITSPGFPRDEYGLSGSGGGLDIGWAVANAEGTLVVPFVQAGYYGYSLEFTNRQTDSISFFEGKRVAPGVNASYTGWAPRLALGVALTSRFGTSDVAPVLNVRLTWGSMLSRPRWLEPDGSEVNNGGLTPAYNGVSLSVQVGVGGV